MIKALFAESFREKRVLDIGSLDINGNNRFLFEKCEYIGIDVGSGPNVDIVGKAHELDHPNESYDTIISTECFEHDRFYRETLRNALRMLRPGGLLIFSCASTGRPPHGVSTANPESSPFTSQIEEWKDYYKNLTEQDIREAIDIDANFTMRYSWTCSSSPETGHMHTVAMARYQFMYCPTSCDLYFWGIKGNPQPIHVGTILQ